MKLVVRVLPMNITRIFVRILHPNITLLLGCHLTLTSFVFNIKVVGIFIQKVNNAQSRVMLVIHPTVC